MGDLESILFGREQIFSHVEKRVEALQKGYRQNIGIIGPEGCGKTYLLHGIYRFLVDRKDLLTIFFNAESLGVEHFVNRFIGSNLSSALESASENHSGNLDELLNRCLSVIPKTVEKAHLIRKLLRKGEPTSGLVKELFSLTAVLNEETGKKIILMIDEFHLLENLPVSDPFSVLGKEMMVQKETLYLVTSSKPEKAREIFCHKLSLLFGNFEVLELSSLSCQETSNYLKQLQPRFVFSDAQIKYLIHMTDGIPVYLELLLDQLGMCIPVSHAMSESDSHVMEIPNERLFYAFSKETFDHRGRLALLFEKRLQMCRRFAKDATPYIQAMLAISLGRSKIVGIATFIDKKLPETQKILDRLLGEEMVSKRGSFYMIEDQLFRFWLNEVYQRKQSLFRPYDGNARVEFLNMLQNTYNRIASETRQTILTRIEGLFRDFRYDLVEVNHRKWRCPHFLEIACRPSENRASLLVARNARSRWVCQIATFQVREDDVNLFKEELKRYRKKVQRAIVILLAGIDQNAKLLAQEAKIHLWDLHHVNILLELYNLPKIIMFEDSHESNLGALAESLSQA